MQILSKTWGVLWLIACIYNEYLSFGVTRRYNIFIMYLMYLDMYHCIKALLEPWCELDDTFSRDAVTKRIARANALRQLLVTGLWFPESPAP